MQSLLVDRQHKPSKNLISSTAGADPNLLKEPIKILDILVVEVSVERAYILRQRPLILFFFLLIFVKVLAIIVGCVVPGNVFWVPKQKSHKEEKPAGQANMLLDALIIPVFYFISTKC